MSFNDFILSVGAEISLGQTTAVPATQTCLVQRYQYHQTGISSFQLLLLITSWKREFSLQAPRFGLLGRSVMRDFEHDGSRSVLGLAFSQEVDKLQKVCITGKKE